MRIAAVVDNKDIVVPLPDGRDIVIYNTANKRMERYHNPGFDINMNRRMTTTEFMAEKNVGVVCTVPGTFCPVSLGKALDSSMKFIRVKKGIKFRDIISNLDSYLVDITNKIPDDELFKKR